VGRGYVRFAVANPEQFGIMFRLELLDPDDAEFQAAGDAAYTLLAATVARCVEEGRLDADPLRRTDHALATGRDVPAPEGHHPSDGEDYGDGEQGHDRRGGHVRSRHGRDVAERRQVEHRLR